MRSPAARTILRTSRYGNERTEAVVSNALKRPRKCATRGVSVGNTAFRCHSFARNNVLLPASNLIIGSNTSRHLQHALSIQYRYMSHNKDAITSSRVVSTKKRKKRQNIKRQAALTKKDKMLAPAATTKAEIDYPGEIAVAIKERITPTLQANVDTIRDYAKSLVKSDHPRAKRIGPKMDSKWWTVNIILALTPAALLAIYCESQRRPMEEYFKGVREKERRRIMGEFGVEEDEAAEAVNKLDIGESEVRKSFSDRVSDALEEVRAYTSSMHDYATGLIREEREHNDDGINAKEEDSGDSLSSEHAKEGTKEAVATDAPPAGPDGANLTADPSIDALIRRIEALEEQLGTKKAAEERNKRMREHQLQYQLQRAGQSGVQNRIEDRWIDEWRKQEKENIHLRKKEANTDTEDKTPDFSVLGIIKENARQKGKILMEYGSSALNALQDAVQASANPEQETTGRDAQNAENTALSESKSEDVPKAKTIASTVSAVEQTAAVVQQSAKSAQASVDALGKGNVNHAASKAIDAAEEANAAAQSALVAVRNASNKNDGQSQSQSQNATDRSTTSNQGAVRQAGGWISRIFGHPRQAKDDNSPDKSS